MKHKYKAHHDYIIHNRDRQQGVRILTVFLYLNDVEAGGGTNFDRLSITVEPKRGRVLLWPSVLDDKPHEKDGRTTHQALPVEAGVKYGANAWCTYEVCISWGHGWLFFHEAHWVFACIFYSCGAISRDTLPPVSFLLISLSLFLSHTLH
jgi:2OG-Fe(II) oxygenase superfamily